MRRTDRELPSPKRGCASAHLRDDATAGEAIARIASGIGHVVILACMNDNRRAVGVQQRARTWLERYIRDEVFHRVLRRSRHLDIREVTGMVSAGIEKTMLMSGRIEVPAC